MTNIANIPAGKTYSVYAGETKTISSTQNFINDGTLQIGVYFSSGEVVNKGQFQNFGEIKLGPLLTISTAYSKFYNEGFLNIHPSNDKNKNTMLHISHDGQYYQKSGGAAYIVGGMGNGFQGGVLNYGLMDFASDAGDFTLGKEVDYQKGTYGHLVNGGTINLDSKMILNNGSEVDNNKTWNIGTNGSLIANKFSSYIQNSTSGYILNNGKIESTDLGSTLMNNGTIDSTFGVLNWKGGVSGSGKYIGSHDLSGKISPGNSAGGLCFDGDLTLQAGAVKDIELSGDSDLGRDRKSSEHDFIDVTGDLIINGGTLQVSLIDGFELDLNQEFIIAKVDGELTGTYEGLEEGAIVGSFDSVYGQIPLDLFITYEGGDGNDVALYTADNLFGISNI